MENKEFIDHEVKDKDALELAYKIMKIIYENNFNCTDVDLLASLAYLTVTVSLGIGIPKHNLLNNISHMYEDLDPENRF